MREVIVVLGTKDQEGLVYGVFYESQFAKQFRHYLLEKKVESRQEAATILEYNDAPIDFALMYR